MISQLGRYEILSEIGQGAMGVVYKAKDPLIDRVVAIKTINLGLAMEEKEEYEGRFYQEAKAAGRLSHPNIVTIYDVGKSGDVAYIAMEFLQGRELRDIMNEGEILPVEKALDIAAQVARGLAYAHEHGIVHRDVKPSNIMVASDGHVKITDFGIARMASAAVHTQTGMVVGSPKYMSPEQVMGKEIDQRSDVFSLGVMLYEILTGQVPFAGENVNAIMYQTLNSIPMPPRSVNPGVPEMANFIVSKALSKGAEDRYQNAYDFAADLRTCRDNMPHIGQQTDASQSPTGEEKDFSSTFNSTRQNSPVENVTKPDSTIGLSPAFDSAAAVMRLAALTATGEDVEMLSRTLNMARPSAEEIKQSAPTAKAAYFVAYAARINRVEQLSQSRQHNFLLVIIALLVLLGIAAILVL